LGAVVEPHARAQLQRPLGEVAVRLEALREVGLGLVLVVEDDEGVVDGVGHRGARGDDELADTGEPVGGLGLERDGDASAVLRALTRVLTGVVVAAADQAWWHGAAGRGLAAVAVAATTR